MQKLFISDLHLSEDHPRLTRGFLDLLQHYREHRIELYILGDWFNAWLADGDPSQWLLPIVAELRQFTAAGNQLYFLPGNRDFVLGQAFLDRFGGQLLKEPFEFDWRQLRIRIEHGDALCTDDLAYQRFKKIIRNPILLGLLKCLPFYLKRRLAALFRNKSEQLQQDSHYQPIDVNPQTVIQHMQQVDLMIHGHTHRAAIHEIPANKCRIVLGDWRDNEGVAEILALSDKGDIHLFNWCF